jgi:hypothetical protein
MAKLTTLSTVIAKSNPDIIAISENGYSQTLQIQKYLLIPILYLERIELYVEGVGSAYMLSTPY